jgi:hypothetical protein
MVEWAAMKPQVHRLRTRYSGESTSLGDPQEPPYCERCLTVLGARSLEAQAGEPFPCAGEFSGRARQGEIPTLQMRGDRLSLGFHGDVQGMSTAVRNAFAL